MKKIQFVRHYRLETAFANWKTITWNNFKLLTEGRADPDISYDGIENVITEEIKLTTVDQVITGTKIRTINTANKIIKHLQLSPEVLSNQLIDEIPSVIEQNISEDQFKSMQRNGKLEVNKHRILNDEESLDRLLRIDGLIRNSKHNNILIVSSSYLIGLLNYFYNFFEHYQNFRVKEAKKYEIGGWLKGFSIQID